MRPSWPNLVTSRGHTRGKKLCLTRLHEIFFALSPLRRRIAWKTLWIKVRVHGLIMAQRFPTGKGKKLILLPFFWRSWGILN